MNVARRTENRNKDVEQIVKLNNWNYCKDCCYPIVTIISSTFNTDFYCYCTNPKCKNHKVTALYDGDSIPFAEVKLTKRELARNAEFNRTHQKSIEVLSKVIEVVKHKIYIYDEITINTETNYKHVKPIIATFKYKDGNTYTAQGKNFAEALINVHFILEELKIND